MKRAVATGELSNGDRFPSVRVISQALKVNPNTVQKAVSELTALGLLQVHSGQGCYVSAKSVSSAKAQRQALTPMIERLVIEAAHHGMDEPGLLGLVRAKWREIKMKPDRP
ncbi:MAG: GntR family transcriptional regulator [Verrucomicrobiota bacterium]|nr:GntR family transcriptional regulator [Verrucomicrobiota bacterium]